MAIREELVDVSIHVIENGSNIAANVVSEYEPFLKLSYYNFEEGNKSAALNEVTSTLSPNAFLIFFDDDIAVHSGSVAAFVEAFKQFGQGFYFGGRLYSEYEKAPSSEVLPYLPLSAREVDYSDGEKFKVYNRFQPFLGACWACFLGDLIAAEGFNPDFGPGAKSTARGQETNTQLSLFRLGVSPVGVAKAAVNHYVPAEAVTDKYVVERIFKAMIHIGQKQSSITQTVGLIVKAIYSALLLPFDPTNVGHRYRLAKVAGYLYGLSK